MDISLIPPELRKSLQKKSEIKIVRKWIDTRKSIVAIAEPEVMDYFNSIEERDTGLDKKIRKSLHDLSNLVKTLEI